MALQNPLILPASRMRTLFAGVSGPIEPSYQLIWGTDGNSSRPIRALSGSATYTVAVSGFSNFAALGNSNVSVGFTSGLGVSAATGFHADGVAISPFIYNPTGVTGSLSFAITGNPDTVVIGQLIGGQAFELQRPFPPGTERVYNASSIERSNLWGHMPPYDLNGKWRGLNTTLTVKQEDCDNLIETWESQRGGSLPTGIVPRRDRNDFWLGHLTAFSYRRQGPSWFEVSFQFLEDVHCRW